MTIPKVQNIPAEQLNIFTASNMEMVGIYSAALEKGRKVFYRSIKNNTVALSKY